MTEFSQNWAMKIYARLWAEFGTNQFSRKQAEKVATNSNLPQAFSKLKRAGWLKIDLDPNHARKSLYTLRNPIEVILEIGRGE